MSVRFGHSRSLKRAARRPPPANLLAFSCGLRVLRASPGFTSVAVLTLALGIAVNTAVFLAALLACFLPARRATRVDPIQALRCE